MWLKGFDKFRAKMPILSGKGILLVPLFVIVILAITLALFIFVDHLPGLLLSAGTNQVLLSLLPPIAVLVVELVGFVLVSQMWRFRDEFKKRYGALSYRRIAPVGFAGVLLAFVALQINQFIRFYSLSSSFWSTSPLRVLGVPLDSLLASGGSILFWVKTVLALVFLVFGILMWVRAFLVLGFDYMAVVYLYFPEDSEIKDNQVYTALRHPMYAGVILINIAGTLSTFTVFSGILCAAFIVGFWIHVHFVEERELIKRFGPSYAEYRNRVPAFFVSPSHIGTLIRFLFR